MTEWMDMIWLPGAGSEKEDFDTMHPMFKDCCPEPPEDDDASVSDDFKEFADLWQGSVLGDAWCCSGQFPRRHNVDCSSSLKHEARPATFCRLQSSQFASCSDCSCTLGLWFLGPHQMFLCVSQKPEDEISSV